jgi:hypothetical protein
MELERDQEAAAAREAAQIGGDPYDRQPGEEGDPLDYIETDGRPAGQTDESWRPVEEAGGGEAEGFEQAESELIERAENAHGPSPMADAEGVVEDSAALDPEYGEADEELTAEDDPAQSDR